MPPSLRRILVAIILVGTSTAGCWSSTRYETAQTLEPEKISFGMGFSAISFQDFCSTVEVEGVGEERECVSDNGFDPSEAWIPNLLPDFQMRFGLIDNLDLGVKLLFLGAQADVKYRLIDTEKVDVAIDPGVRVLFPFIFIREISLDLPVLVTFDFGAIQIYAAAAGMVGMWSIPFQDELKTDVTTSGFNGVIGLSLGNKGWFIRPEFGYTRNFMLASSNEASVDMDMDWMHIGIGFGFRLNNDE